MTPLARRQAVEAGIDLSGLTGTGPHGRIVARDVEAARATGARVPSVGAAFPVPTADQIKANRLRRAFRGLARSIACDAPLQSG